MWTNYCRLCTTLSFRGRVSDTAYTARGYLCNHTADFSSFPLTVEFEVLYHVRLHSDRIPTYQPLTNSRGEALPSTGPNLNLSLYHNTPGTVLFRSSVHVTREIEPSCGHVGLKTILKIVGRNNTVSLRDGLHGTGRGSSILC